MEKSLRLIKNLKVTLAVGFKYYARIANIEVMFLLGVDVITITVKNKCHPCYLLFINFTFARQSH